MREQQAGLLRPHMLLAIAAFLTHSGCAVAQLVDALSPADTHRIGPRPTDCEARVMTGPQTIVHIPSGGRATFRYAGRLVNASVITQDDTARGPEVSFTWTEHGENLTGILRSLGIGEPCGASGTCRILPANLALVFTPLSGIAKTVFEQDVTVRDTCANNGKQRLFKTASWVEKVIRLGASH